MKINLGQNLLNLNGEKLTNGIEITWKRVLDMLLLIQQNGGNLQDAIKNTEAQEKNPNNKTYVNLKTICVEALMTPDDKLSGEKKLEYLKLSQQLHVGDFDFKTEQIVLLKELISKRYPQPLISGTAWQMLEGETLVDNGKSELVEKEKPLKVVLSDRKKE